MAEKDMPIKIEYVWPDGTVHPEPYRPVIH